MFQSHESSNSFRGFFPETESILMHDNEPSMRAFFPANHEHLSLSIGARLKNNMTFQSVENFNQGTNYNSDVKISKYLNPAKELLHMICSVGEDSNQGMMWKKWEKLKARCSSSSSSLSVNVSLRTLDVLEQQRKRDNLLKLLKELDRRYKRYRERMRSLAWSFEASAGCGAAAPYLALASKAMSSHFRRLKDGIIEQIKALKTGMAGKDHQIVHGKTPKLRLLDQCFQNRKAIQLRGFAFDQKPWRAHRGLPERSVSVLRAWLFEHFLQPYPNDIEKHILARQTGLSRSQVCNWFINARVRLWKPMIEAMYMEEIKEIEDLQVQDNNFNPNSTHDNEKEQNLIVIVGTESDSGSLSTIVNERHRFNSYNGHRNMENFIGDGGGYNKMKEEVWDFSFKSAESFLLRRADGGVSIS